MDLKSYAVWRKLTTNSDLLKYVVEDKPIPVDVLEDNLREVIDGIHEPNSELVVHDYQRYLKEHVRLGFQPDGKHELDVNGEIEEPLMESIEMLHHVNRRDVIHDLITSVMKDVNSDKEIKVDNIELMKSATEFVSLSEKPLFNDGPSDGIKPDVPEIKPLEDINPVEEAAPFEEIEPLEEQNPEEEFEPVEEHNPVEGIKPLDVDAIDIEHMDFPEEVTPEKDVAQKPAEEEVVEKPAAKSPADDINLDFMSKDLPETSVKLTEPIFEQPDDIEEDIIPEDVPEPIDKPSEAPVKEPVVEPAEPVESASEFNPDDAIIKQSESNESHENPFKLGYEYVIQQLKDRHIDTRLPGLHLA